MYKVEQLSYEDQLKDLRWTGKRLKIIKRDGYRCCMCGSLMADNTIIQVHHRYYIYGAMAWEYDDNVLSTLCLDCHSLIHKTIPPLIYIVKKDRLIRMNFTPCYRCNGAGYFPEYKNIENGICFRCRGQRYEELIDSTDSHKTKRKYELPIDDVFDLYKPLEEEKDKESLYEQGINFQWGINGISFDVKSALGKYREAALNGHAEAQFSYALLLEKEITNNNVTYIDIRRWYVYSAIQGNAQAQFNLERIYTEGLGVDKDDCISSAWKKLTEKNDDFYKRVKYKLNIKESIKRSPDAFEYNIGRKIGEQNLSIESVLNRLDFFSTEVTEDDLANGIEDEFGVIYSADGKRLLKCNNEDLIACQIKNGTEIICDNAFDFSYEYPIDNECVFMSNSNLKELFLPETVRAIGNYAFRGSCNIHSIVIPQSVISIGKNPFVGIQNITCLSDKYITDGVALYDFKKRIIISVYNYSSTYIIPNSVEILYNGSFYDCNELENIHIPENVKYIFSDCFSFCQHLQSIHLSDGIEKIEMGSFYQCSNLCLIVVPNGKVNTFDNKIYWLKDCFTDEKDLETTFDENELKFGVEDEFGVIYSADGTKLIKANRSLEIYTIKKGTKVICDNAFIPKSMSEKKLYRVVLPDTIVSIGEAAFANNEYLVSINIPRSVINIKNNPFIGCFNLRDIEWKTIYYAKVGPFIMDKSKRHLISCLYSYYDPSIRNIYSFESFMENYKYVRTQPEWNNFDHGRDVWEWLLSDENNNCVEVLLGSFEELSFDDILREKEKLVIAEIDCYYQYDLKYFAIGKDFIYELRNKDRYKTYPIERNMILPPITKIGAMSFKNNIYIEEITLSNNIESIEPNSFEGCYNLKKIFIPRGLRDYFEKIIPDLKDLLVEEDIDEENANYWLHGDKP